MDLSHFGATVASPFRKLVLLMAVIALLGCLLLATAFATSIFATSLCTSCRSTN